REREREREREMWMFGGGKKEANDDPLVVVKGCVDRFVDVSGAKAQHVESLNTLLLSKLLY
ncbi:hypothetical protein, partial [Corallococcus sp. AB049A]|uniref:hypothetical protein n=1 Tax=Corallococcus sp. AB049A TaxID=2316721 RepID=UPI001F1B76AE